MVGKTILHYRVLREIGKGGMGVVYKAEDSKLHRIVAIKALSADLIGDEKARARFMREARAASAIDHPNICTVYEVNEADGSLFFVMQYVEGRTLKKAVSTRPLAVDAALEYMLEITDALAAAHAKGIVHRDIKSSNIMINERGQVKVLDFGLAKVLRPSTSYSSSEAHVSVELTQLGSPFGTASYMSPEQARGDRADMRSDIFSLGIVFYEMLTGRLPFRGKTPVDVMHSVMHDQPAAIEGMPPQLQQIVTKTLAKDPNARYQSAERLLADLRALVRSYYAGEGVPRDKAALRAAARPPAQGGIFNRMASWMQRTFNSTPPPTVKEETSAGSGSPVPDASPSMWQSRDKKAIAILPFKNMSGSPENDFYGFSLADSVITELAQLHELIVRPSSYIAPYQNRDVDPRAVGAQLAVDHVLIGGYVKSGDRFRLTPQLVDTATGEIIWSEKIDVESKDIITIQDTISRQIVEGLRVKTSSKEQERLVKTPTENAEAYENYLKGRTLLYKFITQTLDIHDLDAALELFAGAVEMDPNFALAYSGLGVCELNYVLKGMGGRDYYAQAKMAFERALALNPKLVEPRVRLVYIDLIEGRSDVARQEIRRLQRQAPNEPSVHSTAAYVYRLSGQYEPTLQAWDRLLKISPTDVVFASYNRARIYIYEREYDRAAGEIAKGQAFEPHHPLLRFYGAVIDYYRGNIDEATQVIEAILAEHPELHARKIFLAYCYVAQGDRERALGLIDEQVIETAYADQDIAYQLATFYALDRQNTEAVDWLERAVAMGNENYPWFSTNPNWEGLRDDLRYRRLLNDLKERWEQLSGPA